MKLYQIQNLSVTGDILTLVEILKELGFTDVKILGENKRITAKHESYLGNSGAKSHRRTYTGWMTWMLLQVIQERDNLQNKLESVRSFLVSL